jgi:hypothetical protein
MERDGETVAGFNDPSITSVCNSSSLHHTSHITPSHHHTSHHHTSHTTHHTSHITHHTSHITHHTSDHHTSPITHHPSHDHTSHTTHHTPHTTHHTPHITHHTSHITHHTSQITHHTSHITDHTSHITHHTSQITHHPPPTTHYSCFRFYVPWDAKGLAQLYATTGRDMCMLIDDAQSMPNPTFSVGAYGNEIHEQTEMADRCWGQYAHNNQPVHHMLYMMFYKVNLI